MTDAFDVLVLGAGSGGYACALRAAQLGLSVALVEKDRVGGTCLHVGCIPTKALLHAAEVADSAREAGRFGVRATLDGIDIGAVRSYQEDVVGRLYKGLTGLIKGRGITVIQGEGRLVDAHTVAVGESTYTGASLVVATGSYAKSLPGIEFDGERVITSEQALRLDRVPGSVVILGGGVIGCEFASVWRSFGAEVTIVEALSRLLPPEDADSSAALQRAFRKRGITALTSTPLQGVERTRTGVAVTVINGDVIEADLLLVAVGRGPATDGVGLEEAGIALDRGFVTVDDRLRTSVEGVYAVGDIASVNGRGGLQLAHRGFAQGIFVAEQIAGLEPRPIDEDAIPRVTYSHPEVASVGLTQESAEAAYPGEVEALTYDLAGNGKSQILATQGFVKLVRRKDGPVLGVHLVGDRVGELVGEAQLAYGWEAFPDDVAPLVHAHPTQNEALGEAFLALAGKPLHTHT